MSLVMLTLHPTDSQQNEVTLKSESKNTHKHTYIYNMSVVCRNT